MGSFLYCSLSSYRSFSLLNAIAKTKRKKNYRLYGQGRVITKERGQSRKENTVHTIGYHVSIITICTRRHTPVIPQFLKDILSLSCVCVIVCVRVWCVSVCVCVCVRNMLTNST